MKKILICFLTIILVFTNYTSVFAVNINLGQEVKTYSFNTDTTLTGVNTKHSKYFKVDNMWDVSDVTLKLVISQSELINKDESNLSIYINGVAFHSLKLSEKMGYKSSITVKVPLDKVKKGFNEITIKSTRRISDKPCSDDYNVGNWIVINKESGIDVSFKNKLSENNLSFFPYPYLKNEASNIGVNILVPNEFSDIEGEAVLRLSSYISSKNKDEDVNINVTNNFTKEVYNNDFICIGRFNYLPNEIKTMISSSEVESLNKNALIKQVVMPNNSSKKMIIITSLNDELLINGTKYLCNNNLTLQSYNNSVLVGGDFKTDTLKEKDSNNVTFEKLGYDNIKFEGPFKHTAEYKYTLPKNREMASNGKISIKCSYSKNLDFEKSLLSVDINGSPIGSKKLEEVKANDDILELTIPEVVGKENIYNITVRFDLEVKDVYCDFSSKETPYAYISNTSFLNIPTKEIEKPKLEDFPSPFISSGEYNDTVFVVDSNNINSLNTASSIASFIGKSLEYNTGSIKFKTSSSLSEDEKKSNLIVIGSSLNNKIINEIGNKLYIKYNNDYTSFVNNEKIQLSESYAKNIATVQIIESPFNSKNNVLVVTSPKAELIEKAVPYLSIMLKVSKLSGEASIIDANSNVTNYSFTDNSSEDKQKSELGIGLNKENKILVIFTGVVIISLISGYIFIVKKYRK